MNARSIPVLVIAGYDRSHRTLYLQVWEDPQAHSRRDQEVLYASHLDVHRDWSDVSSVADALDALAITVPGSFIQALEDDQLRLRCDRPPRTASAAIAHAG